jgi:hypothetical protein
MHRTHCLMAGFVILFSHSAHAQTPEFCDVFNNIREHANSQFSNSPSTLNLPGADECEIVPTRSEDAFQCTWENRSATRSLHDRLVSDISRCLGPSIRAVNLADDSDDGNWEPATSSRTEPSASASAGSGSVPQQPQQATETNILEVASGLYYCDGRDRNGNGSSTTLAFSPVS